MLSIDKAIMIKRVNRLIERRNTYSSRLVRVERMPCCVIKFSNANATWFIQPSQLLGGLRENKLIVLDSNQILVYYSESEVKDILDKLNVLPLYRNSLEFQLLRSEEK